MEKSLITQLNKALPQLFSLSKINSSFSVDLDAEGDVVYISFEKPQQATDTQMLDDDILLRKRNDKIVGVTIMHASKRLV